MTDVRIYPAARWEQLADGLAEQLSADDLDPLTSHDLVLPRPRGALARWLRDALATRLGVLANVRFLGLERALLERAGTFGEATAFSGEGADLLTIAASLPAAGSDPAFAAIDDYLRDDRARGVLGVRTVAFVKELARSLHRAEGRSSLERAAWPVTHRALFERLHDQRHSRPRSLEERLVSSKPTSLGPLHVVGWPRLSPVLLRSLLAPPVGPPVSLYVLAASPAGAASAPRHPLLRANDRVGCAALAEARDRGASFFPMAPPMASRPTTLLARLQADLASDGEERPGAAAACLERVDDSLQVHAGHGPRRQVEILHDALLALFESDPTLSPRDVRIATPDIATYEPLLRATFASGEASDGRAWPLVFADGISNGAGIVTTILDETLGVLDGRFTTKEILALLGHAPVRARFDLGSEDITQLEAWLDLAAVRWGRDGQHRAACLGVTDDTSALALADEGTWAFGLDRLALAITSPPEIGLFAGRLPFHDLEGEDARVAGALLAFVRVLLAHATACASPADVSTWIDRAETMLRTLTAPGEDDEDEATHDPFGDVRRSLEALRDTNAGASLRLDLAGFRALLRDGDLLGDRTRGARGGRLDALTVGSLTRDNALPARVVALVGVDAEVFPRRDHDSEVASPQGTESPLDADAAAEDRTAFLQTLLSARETLIVVAGLFDARTNAARPPAAPLAELLERLSELLVPSARAALITPHPLQPFGEGAFLTEAGTEPRSHDRRGLAIAEALRSPFEPLPGMFDELLARGGALPDYTEPDIDLSTLTSFFRDPIRTLLRLRLRTGVPRGADARADREPIELDGLGRARLRDRYLHEALRPGASSRPEVLRATLRATGELPLGGVGDAVLEEHERALAGLREAFGDRIDELCTAVPSTVRLPIAIEGGTRTLRGVVAGRAARRLVRVTLASPAKPARLLEAYLSLLALAGADGPPVNEAELLGVDEAGEPQRVVLGISTEPGAREATLARYVHLFVKGLSRPLRFGERTSFAFGSALHTASWSGAWADASGEAAHAATAAARGVWSQRNAEGHDVGEGTSPSLFAAFGGRAIYHADQRAEHDGALVDRAFADIAQAVYGPVLSALRADTPLKPGSSRRAPSA